MTGSLMMMLKKLISSPQKPGEESKMQLAHFRLLAGDGVLVLPGLGRDSRLPPMLSLSLLPGRPTVWDKTVHEFGE